MAIRKRIAVSAPKAFNENVAIRTALKEGLRKIQSDVDFESSLTNPLETEILKLHEQETYMRGLLAYEGILSIVKKA